uniref:Dehydrogenase/reductase SDR family member 4 n=2 Tax=Panagrellus redivivus TaxID=6233 RepID=A0A7E4VL18_PANRE
MAVSLRNAHTTMGSVKFLTDRVAIVTASTKGIGFAIAKRLGMDGASIVVSSRKQKNVDEAVTALRHEGVECDGVVAHVGIDDDRKKLVDFALDRFGKLDILVSNAAVNPHYGDLMSVSDSHWDKLLNVNVRSAFLLTQEAVPHLEKSGNGNIVFVSSVAGYSPFDGIGAYSIMKTALLGINKSLSQNLARKNIRVNAIAPGVIRTDFSRALTDGPAPLKADTLIPLGRFGEADECAGAVSFLVSDGASYMSGEVIGVNGGMQARI